jgi:hypothetical protein
MKTRSGIGKAMTAVVLGGAVAFASLTGGIVHADGGDVDGRDFLVWQRQLGPVAQAAVGGSDLADWQSNYGIGASASTGAFDSEYKYVPVRR